MGFFDFISNAVGAVKNIVSHTPIVSQLGSLAGIVSHAIPTVGPIIDAAVPAVQAIFSKDNTAPNAGQEPKPPSIDDLQKPIMSKLDQQDTEIKNIISNVTSLSDNITKQYNDLQSSLKDKLDVSFEQMKVMLKHDKYNDCLLAVSLAGKWMDARHDDLQMTANSGIAKFEKLFKEENNILQARHELNDGLEKTIIEISDKSQVPAQDMLDLYLLGLHWLLIFDKAILIARGMLAKKHYADQKWGSYLLALNDLEGDITTLHKDTFAGRKVLTDMIDRLTSGGSSSSPSTRASAVQVAGDLSIKDDWMPLTIGYMDITKVKDVLSLGMAKVASHNTLTLEIIHQRSPVLKAWQELADQALDFHLRPARAVVQSLEDNLRQWNSRVPVKPKGLPETEAHVTAKVVEEAPSHVSKLSIKDKDAKLAGQHLRYALSYVNAFGESTSSDFTGVVKTKEDDKFVLLHLHPVTFKDDPLDGLARIKDQGGSSIEPDHGIRRRIYLTHPKKGDEGDVNYLLAEVDEDVKAIVHELSPASE